MSILRNKANAELALKLFAQARASYVKLWALDQSDIRDGRMLALLENRAGNPEQAKQVLAQLQKAYPGSPLMMEVEGDVLVEQQDMAGALAAYRLAYKTKPSRSVAVKLFQLAKQSGGDPNTYLRDWLENSPEDVSVRLVLAQQLQGAGKTSQAIDEYEKLIAVDAKNPVVLNNLAWLYYEQPDGKAKVKALSLARQASELTPQVPAIMDTHGWLLFRSGQIQEGMKILAEAESLAREQALPDLQDISYHYAVALNETGDQVGARNRIENILKNDRPFASRNDAQLLLETLKR